jgi:hypothetical protein
MFEPRVVAKEGVYLRFVNTRQNCSVVFKVGHTHHDGTTVSGPSTDPVFRKKIKVDKGYMATEHLIVTRAVFFGVTESMYFTSTDILFS